MGWKIGVGVVVALVLLAGGGVGIYYGVTPGRTYRSRGRTSTYHRPPPVVHRPVYSPVVHQRPVAVVHQRPVAVVQQRPVYPPPVVHRPVYRPG